VPSIQQTTEGPTAKEVATTLDAGMDMVEKRQAAHMVNVDKLMEDAAALLASMDKRSGRTK
jgi:hypothetical protein